jgi:hypothetical protein
MTWLFMCIALICQNAQWNIYDISYPYTTAQYVLTDNVLVDNLQPLDRIRLRGINEDYRCYSTIDYVTLFNNWYSDEENN